MNIHVNSVPLVAFGSPYAAADAAFKPMRKLPRGHMLVQVKRDRAHATAPIGSCVVVDKQDRKLVHDQVYVIRWNDHADVSIMSARFAQFGKRMAWSLRAPMGGITEGPYRSAEAIEKLVIGRVVGLFTDADDQPMRPLFTGAPSGLGVQRSYQVDELPEIYAMQVAGRCMEPIYPNDCKLRFSRLEHAKRGDDVVIWRKPEITEPGSFQCLVKRLVTPLPRQAFPHPFSTALTGVLVVEALNPRRRYTVPTSEIMAVHKCIGLHEVATK